MLVKLLLRQKQNLENYYRNNECKYSKVQMPSSIMITRPSIRNELKSQQVLWAANYKKIEFALRQTLAA